MTQDILITPGSGEPQILFRGSGVNDTPIELNVLSSYQSANGSGTALLFEGQEGQLFSITDNLSSGVIFSVGDITGLSLLSIDASGDVKIGEFGRYVGVGQGDPAYGLDVFSSGNFRENVVFNNGINVSGQSIFTTINDAAAIIINSISSSGNAFVVTDSLNDTTPFTISNTGNVGIGTFFPTYKLMVVGDMYCSGNATFDDKILADDNTTSNSVVYSFNGDDNTGIGREAADNMTLVAAGGTRVVIGWFDRTIVNGNTSQYGFGVRHHSTGTPVYFGATTYTNPDAVISNAGGTELIRFKNNGQTRFQPLGGDPAGAEAGDVYYNSSTNKLRLYNGTSWVDLN